MLVISIYLTQEAVVGQKTEILQEKLRNIMEEYYSRNDNPNKSYLSPDLNVIKLYHGFKEKYETKFNQTPVESTGI